MKQSIISMLVLLCLTVSGAWAQNPSWVRDGDTWDDASKTLTVNSNLPEDAYKYQDVIQHVIINNGVTSIGVSVHRGTVPLCT